MGFNESVLAKKSFMSNGGMIEKEYLGEVNMKKYWDLYGSFDNIRRKSRAEISEQDFKILMEADEKAQRWSEPSDPAPDFANDLHATIADKLQLEDYSDLEYYTAVGSDLDEKGVDAFFKLKKDGQEFVVTLDLKTDINKPDSNSEIIFYVPADDIMEQGSKQWKEIIEDVAKNVVSNLKRKINN